MLLRLGTLGSSSRLTGESGAGAGAAAMALLGADEGLAFDFLAQSAAARSNDGSLTRYGRPGDFLTHTRSTSARFIGSNQLLQTASAGVLRHTYDPTTGAALGALFENAATNICLQSEDFSIAPWVLTSASATPNNSASPDGGTSSDTVDFTADTGSIYQDITVTANTAYTFSFWRAFGSKGSGRVAFYNVTGAAFVTEDSAVTTQTYLNGLSRVTATVTTPAGCTSLRVYPQRGQAGDATGTMSFFGAQLETGSAATSYIPTTVSSVQRTKDSASLTLSTIPFDAAGYSYFVDWVPTILNSGYGNRIFCLSDGGTTNVAEVTNLTSPATSLRVLVLSASVSQASVVISSSYTANTRYRIAAAHAVNNVRMSSAGGAVSTDLANALPIGLSKLTLGNNAADAGTMTGVIRQVALIKRFISDAELISQSTIPS